MNLNDESKTKIKQIEKELKKVIYLFTYERVIVSTKLERLPDMLCINNNRQTLEKPRLLCLKATSFYNLGDTVIATMVSKVPNF